MILCQFLLKFPNHVTLKYLSIEFFKVIKLERIPLSPLMVLQQEIMQSLQLKMQIKLQALTKLPNPILPSLIMNSLVFIL